LALPLRSRLGAREGELCDRRKTKKGTGVKGEGEVSCKNKKEDGENCAPHDLKQRGFESPHTGEILAREGGKTSRGGKRRKGKAIQKERKVGEPPSRMKGGGGEGE